MTSRSSVIKELINEIHHICVQNKIEYFVAGEIAMLIYKHGVNSDAEKGISGCGKCSDENMPDTGMVFMTAENFQKFILHCEKDIHKCRAIEWMGNNESFPGLFARYINTDTTCYTPQRLAYEKKLGMYVTIRMLRPASRSNTYYQAWERAYENLVKGQTTTGKKLEPILRKRIIWQIKTTGADKAVRRIAEVMINRYCHHGNCNKYWTKDETGDHVQYYPAKLFERCDRSRIGNMEVCVSASNDKLVQDYSKPDGNMLDIRAPYNDMDFFCDSDIPYRELDIDKYRKIITNILQQDEEIKRRIRPYKRIKEKMYDAFFRTYYRYYYGPYLLERINELEALYEADELEKLDMILRPYTVVLKKYGKIYISDRVNALINKLYDIDIDEMFKDMPEIYKAGILIYDYRGRYVGIAGKNR